MTISIHALVKRATQSALDGGLCLWDFNPRPREEGDILPKHGNATRNHFNPRPREEGDLFRLA